MAKGAAPRPGLSARERKFAEAYAGEAAGNGIRAATLAGYGGTRESLATLASRQLKKVEVRQLIDTFLENDPLVMSRIDRLRRLSLIGAGKRVCERFDNDGNVYQTAAPTRDQIAAIKELGELAGDYLKKADDSDRLPVGLTIAQLLELAGAGRQAR